MTPSEIEATLMATRGLRGRQGYIAGEIERLGALLERAQAQLIKDAAAPRARPLTGLPVGTEPGDPTAHAALELASGEALAGQDGAEVRRLQAQIAHLEAEAEACAVKLRYVEAWLSGLTGRERLVVECRLIDGEMWLATVERYDAVYREDTTVRRLRRLLGRAIERICEMCGEGKS